MHPSSTKMYQDLNTSLWFSGMKRDVLEFVTKCLGCQKVKAEHQVPSGLLQPIKYPSGNGIESQWILWSGYQ